MSCAIQNQENLTQGKIQSGQDPRKTTHAKPWTAAYAEPIVHCQPKAEKIEC